MSEETVKGFDSLKIGDVMASLDSEYNSLDGGYQNGATKRERDYKIYAMKPYGNEIPGRSKTVDSTTFDKVEWLTPNLVRPFVESDEVIEVEPEDEDSYVASQYMREILTYQLKRSQSWYDIVHSSVKGALIWGQSYAKVHFERRKNAPDMVRIEPVHPSEIRYDTDCDNFYDSSVIVHDVSKTASEIKEMIGQPGYNKEAIEELLGLRGNDYKYLNERGAEQRERVNSRMYMGNGASQFDEENKYFVLHEHYRKMDVDGSGIAVPIIATYSRGHLIKFTKNPFPDQEPPFVVFQAIREPFSSLGWSMGDVLGDVQNTRTSIKRDIEDNLAAQANGMWAADMRYIDPMGIRMLRNGVAGSVVPHNGGKPESLAPLPMAPQAFNYLNSLSAEADMKSGYTKSATMDSKMLGAKATSAENVFNSGQMQIWEKAQRMLETGFKPLLRKAIAYNQKWLSASQLKLMFGETAGKWMTFSKDDIGGRLNSTLKISLASDKAERVGVLMNAFQIASQQAATIPGMDKFAKYLLVKILDEQGVKEARSFLEDDKDVTGTGGVTTPTGLEDDARAQSEEGGSLEGVTALENFAGVDIGSAGVALDEAGLGAESFGGTV